MRRRWHLLSVGIAVAIATSAVGAVNASAGGLLGGTGDKVRDTTDNVTDSVNDTVRDTTGTVKDTTGRVTGGAGNVVGGVTGGGSDGSSSTSSGSGTTTTDTGTTTTGTTDTGTTTGTGGTDGGAAGPGGTTGSGGRPQGGGRKSRAERRSERRAEARERHRRQMSVPEPPIRTPDGRPTKSNPGLTVADFGPSPLGVPSFIIDQFEIPPFLLPIYQACGTQYGIPWQVLASINKIETAFGTNLNVSSAGALGWMQFMPATWRAYGVDANGDGRKDPYNPVDAICSAASYLKASGGSSDLRGAIFAYNHADWYVDEVILSAEQYGKLPDDLVGSITGLTQGARFPVAAKSRYADDIAEQRAAARAKGDEQTTNVAHVVSSVPSRKSVNIFSREAAPVVAVNDGTIKRIGHNRKLGDYIVLRDDYGNRFTYAQLGKVAKTYPVPKRRAPKHPAPERNRGSSHSRDGGEKRGARKRHDGAASESARRGNEQERRSHEPTRAQASDSQRRLYAFPTRPHNVRRATLTGQLEPLFANRFAMGAEYGALRYDRDSMRLRRLREGSKVVAGTVLGRVGKTDRLAPHVNFAIRPAGPKSPKIDPKPILDGWKLLEATAVYRAAGENPFDDGRATHVSRDLLMPKPQLQRRVLADPRLSIYSCGRDDIRTGQIDHRVLAGLEYLADNGFRLTVTSMKCGHSTYTTSGNVSAHSTGDAVDIAMVNGIPITGHQGSGSITEAVIKSLLQLQGNLQPDQVISLMNLGGPSFSMADHYDHIHVGWTPSGTPSKPSKQLASILKPDQWKKLVERIADIDNPRVARSPSKYALPDRKPSDRKYIGD